MQKLYKFFFYLFVILFAESFIFGMLLTAGYLALVFGTHGMGLSLGNLSFADWLKASLPLAIVYSLVQFTTVVFLFRLSYLRQKKFTLNHIVNYLFLFIIVTTAVYLAFFAWSYRPGPDGLIRMLLLTPRFSLPGVFWFPFPVAWIALYIFQAQRIKKQPAYGRQDRSFLEGDSAG